MLGLLSTVPPLGRVYSSVLYMFDTRGYLAQSGHAFKSKTFTTHLFLLRSYQKAAVQDYLTNKDVSLPPSSYYSSKNRAYPDVSAMGHNFVVREQALVNCIAQSAWYLHARPGIAALLPWC